MSKLIFVLGLLAAVCGCVAKTDVVTYDLTQRSGLYVLGYTTDENIRRAIEDQLVADIQSRDMQAYPSYVELPVLLETTREGLLAAANAKNALSVLVVNQVMPGKDGVIQNPLRVTPEHPDLASFYEYTKSVERNFNPRSEVFAEVNAFLIQGDTARLIWSGTTWSFDADGKGGAISGMSGNIATELSEIRDALQRR